MSEPITTEETHHISNILKHYAHAKEKHAYFCDWIGPINKSPCDVERVKKQLAISRRCIKRNMKLGRLGWDDILDCEVWEVFDALVRGDKVQAVEELYDCIAVCLRAIDVLEGRQKLGKHAAKEIEKILFSVLSTEPKIWYNIGEVKKGTVPRRLKGKEKEK